MMEGVISSMIYCKNICKCHNISPARITTKKYKKEGPGMVAHTYHPRNSEGRNWETYRLRPARAKN
jgi:hypothetical protein